MWYEPHRPFLTARWSQLCLVNFEVNPTWLESFVPAGLQLEVVDESAFVSLAALHFREVRVLGVSWPGYRSFPQLTLRFQVRSQERRGVTTVRDFAPSKLPCWVARQLYGQPYKAAELSSRRRSDEIAWTLLWGGEENRLEFTLAKTVQAPTSEDSFFLEHKWGYSVLPDGRLQESKVLHPPWTTRRVLDWNLHFDFGKVYGPEWTFLDHLSPRSCSFGVDSQVAIFPPRLSPER